MVHTSYTLSKSRALDTYQYTVNHNNYQDGAGLPAAVFSYDISPMQAPHLPPLHSWLLGGVVGSAMCTLVLLVYVLAYVSSQDLRFDALVLLAGVLMLMSKLSCRICDGAMGRCKS